MHRITVIGPRLVKWIFACFAAIFIISPSAAQHAITAGLQFVENPPGDILATRSVVLHDHSFGEKDLSEIQKAFQQIGIDAVAHFETDVAFAGKDVTRAFAEYLSLRQIKYLIFFERNKKDIVFIATPFEPKSGLFEPSQPAWRVSNERLNDLLRTVFQDSWRSQKKQNFLINEFPETDISINIFKGSRQEFYAIDLKIDALAVPKFGNEAMDKELADFFQANYPLKYKITEVGADEQELRRQGLRYILCFIHTRGSAAREILGYDNQKAGSAYASITFPAAGQLQLKTIPEETEVYKFYFRHIDNGNVFLGTKWDADVTWQDALRNHILGFKLEAKIN